MNENYLAIGGGALLIFLMVVFFVPSKTGVQHQVLRLICAILAGIAGAMLPGEIAVKINAELSDGVKLGINAAGAIAFAVVVWFTYREKVAFPDGVNYAIGLGETFANLVRNLAQMNHATAEFSGFSTTQLGAKLKVGKISAPGFVEAMQAVRSFANDPVPDYDITFAIPKYTITAKP